MRIAVLAHGLRLAGGMVVGKNIVRSLANVGPQHTYLIVAPAHSGYEQLCKAFPSYHFQTYTPRRLNMLSRAMYDVLALPGIVHTFDPDVVLGLASVGLLRPKSPQAIYFMTPHLCYSRDEQPTESLITLTTFRLQAAYFRLQLKRTALLVAQTDAIANRLQKTFPFEGEISVSPIAVSGLAQPGDSSARPCPEILLPFLGKRKLLYLTRYYRHKNIEKIVDTFSRFADRLSDCVVLLTIDPNQERSAAAVIDSIAAPNLRNRIVNIGPVQHEQLAAYYANCDALLMPSLFESFSSTYVEAMNYGLPIITSDLDFARASCGDAALYFDPNSSEAMTDAIRKVLDNPALAQALRNRGRSRLDELPSSWDEVVTDLLVSLEKLQVQSLDS